MATKTSNKINRIRTFALSLVFIGIFVMYIGIFFRSSPIIMTITMILGFLFVVSSSGVYFWIGMISTKAVRVECPTCGKITKILGRVDACMHCDEPLTLDPALEGKEFDTKYNRKSYQSQDEKPQNENQK
ncbi:YgzB family protein [Aliibacillus thermotolerans]|uniref:UPF0295 protein ACFPTR_01305 n=1 Tax=Aliibacillus thermotolerans TaxID=1834418 RepID=A0ABW0U5C5_9BACI|nr:YgzB family protein [Aliibacillus thermotolerans]MDA3129908.1 hypothetical protein [Aliibacillus thermotolerans]